MGVLDLKEVVDLCVARQLLAAQSQRTELLHPALVALTAESFDGGHWQEQRVNLLTRRYFVPQKHPASEDESQLKTLGK